MLESEVEEYTKLIRKVKKLNPEAHCTYFHPDSEYPNGAYQVHEWGKPISDFFVSPIAALKDALKKLKNEL